MCIVIQGKRGLGRGSGELLYKLFSFFFLFQLSATNSMHAELIEDDGESRYKVTDIIGESVVTTTTNVLLKGL